MPIVAVMSFRLVIDVAVKITKTGRSKTWLTEIITGQEFREIIDGHGRRIADAANAEINSLEKIQSPGHVKYTGKATSKKVYAGFVTTMTNEARKHPTSLLKG